MFVATSTASAEQTIFYNQRYEFEFSRQELQRRFVQLDLRSFSVEHLPVSGHDIPDIYQGKLDKDICASAVGRAKIEAYSIAEDRSSLALAGYGPRNENFVLVTTIQTVAAVYDRRRFLSGDILGGHRPPLQYAGISRAAALGYLARVRADRVANSVKRRTG